MRPRGRCARLYILGKALGGGISPCPRSRPTPGARRDHAGPHGSTFGGNPLACADRPRGGLAAADRRVPGARDDARRAPDGRLESLVGHGFDAVRGRAACGPASTSTRRSAPAARSPRRSSPTASWPRRPTARPSASRRRSSPPRTTSTSSSTPSARSAPAEIRIVRRKLHRFESPNSCDLRRPSQREVGRQVGALAGGADPAGLLGVGPGELAGREGDPGVGVQLDDGRRGATGVAHAGDHLHGGVRRHAHLDRVARARGRRARRGSAWSAACRSAGDRSPSRAAATSAGSACRSLAGISRARRGRARRGWRRSGPTRARRCR